MTTTTASPRAARSRARLITCSWWRMSRAAVGSSSSSSNGSWASTRAIAARARSPPERELKTRGAKLQHVGLGHRGGDDLVVPVLGRRAGPGRAAHPHDVGDGEREGDVDPLHQHAAAHRELAGAPLAGRRAVDLDAAGVRLEVAGHDGEQRRLAGAVGPDQREHLAGPHVEARRCAGSARRRAGPTRPRRSARPGRAPPGWAGGARGSAGSGSALMPSLRPGRGPGSAARRRTVRRRAR